MKILTRIDEVRAYRRGLARVGFVPTMGFLHDGHLSLMRASKKECAHTVVSIFVNPTQFGPNEDLDRYPRDFARDKALCEGEGVDCIFCPEVGEMYPAHSLTSVEVEGITKKLCGLSRPTHFKGVTTVVAKLFNIVQPDTAYFGQKDLQQSIVIRKMVRDLNMPLEIKVCPIVRESDCLAMSSRNKYLTEKERAAAPVLYQSLQAAREMLARGETNAAAIKHEMLRLITDRIGSEMGRIDYLEFVDTETLEGVDRVRPGNAIAMAVFVGKTRLIDNLIL